MNKKQTMENYWNIIEQTEEKYKVSRQTARKFYKKFRTLEENLQHAKEIYQQQKIMTDIENMIELMKRYDAVHG